MPVSAREQPWKIAPESHRIGEFASPQNHPVERAERGDCGAICRGNGRPGPPAKPDGVGERCGGSEDAGDRQQMQDRITCEQIEHRDERGSAEDRQGQRSTRIADLVDGRSRILETGEREEGQRDGRSDIADGQRDRCERLHLVVRAGKEHRNKHRRQRQNFDDSRDDLNLTRRVGAACVHELENDD